MRTTIMASVAHGINSEADFAKYFASPAAYDEWRKAPEHQQMMRDFAAPVSHWMVQAVNPQPGETVLELAAGLGETGMLAAELVAPGGEVIVSDQARAMLDGARARAEQEEERRREKKKSWREQVKQNLENQATMMRATPRYQQASPEERQKMDQAAAEKLVEGLRLVDATPINP